MRFALIEHHSEHRFVCCTVFVIWLSPGIMAQKPPGGDANLTLKFLFSVHCSLAAGCLCCIAAIAQEFICVP